MKKITIVLIASLAVLMAGGIGFFAGKQMKQEVVTADANGSRISEISPSSQTVDEGSESRIIAVVNLDEGISKNGTVINYASEISRYPSEHFSTTSLEDAKRGLLTGEYGAYVVIPATFSENVESLNTTIKKAQIIYSVSNQLKDSVKLSVKDEIHTYTNQLNQNVSYLYVDSILDEFHGTQSTISTALANYCQGSQAVDSIEPADLLNYMNIPELKQPNTFVEPVSVDTEVDQNSEQLSQLITAYQEGLATGQETVEEIVSDGNILSESVTESLSGIGNTRIAVDNEGNFKYDNELSEATDRLSTYMTDSAAWTNDILHKMTDEFPAVSAPLHSGQYYYQDSADAPYNRQVADLADFYSQLNLCVDESFVGSSVISVPDVVLKDEGSEGEQLTVIDENDQTIASFEPELVTFADGSQGYAYSSADVTDIHSAVKDAVKVTERSPNDFNIIVTDSSSGEVVDFSNLEQQKEFIERAFPRYGAFNYEQDKESKENNSWVSGNGENRLTEGVTSIDNLHTISENIQDNPLNERTISKEADELQRNLQTNVVDELQKETEGLNQSLVDSSSDLTDQIRSYNQIVSGYNPFGSIDQNLLRDHVGAMETNNQTIVQKSTETIDKMSENLLDTYQVYSENQDSLLTEAEKATEQGNDVITEGLSSAKITMANVADENEMLLNPITTKLAYTKTGSVPNRSVYQYIVSPLNIADQSTGERPISNQENEINPESSLQTGESTDNWWRISIGVGILVLGILITFIIYWVKKRPTEN